MARTGYYTDPSRKQLEMYYDFSGGLNTVTSNDNLSNNETTTLVNMDLGDRGSVQRRHGFKKIETMFRPTTWGDIGAKKWSEL